MRPQLILLGAPGSGKGTQATRLAKELEYEHVSTGDLLRNEVAQGSALGEKVKGILGKGNLVDDHTVLELLSAYCDLSSKNYIFDGFPRTFEQVKLLDEVLIKGHSSKAIFFEIDLENLTNRLVNRRICADCSRIYNLSFHPPKEEKICDDCGGVLEQRADDMQGTVKNRLRVFQETMGPVLAHYESGGRLERVDATDSFDAVYQKIRKILDEEAKIVS